MNIVDATWLVLDTETTGLDPEKDEVVEIAAVAVSLKHGVEAMFATLAQPTVAIPPEFSAIHGLTRKDLEGAPSEDEAGTRFQRFVDLFDTYCYVGHNLEFDTAFLGLPKGLCTKRLAQHLWSDAPNHRNQTLRYWRDLGPVTFGIAPHRALGDALVTAALLVDELTCSELETVGITTVDGLIAFAESPIVCTTWPFGKYRYKPIEAAPADYVAWCLRSMTDLSRDMRHTLELRLGKAA